MFGTDSTATHQNNAKRGGKRIFKSCLFTETDHIIAVILRKLAEAEEKLCFGYI